MIHFQKTCLVKLKIKHVSSVCSSQYSIVVRILICMIRILLSPQAKPINLSKRQFQHGPCLIFFPTLHISLARWRLTNRILSPKSSWNIQVTLIQGSRTTFSNHEIIQYEDILWGGMIPWCHYDSAERQDQFLAHDVNWVDKQTNSQENHRFLRKPSWSRKKVVWSLSWVVQKFLSHKISVPKIHDVSNHPSVFPSSPNPKKTDGTVRPKSVPGTIRSFFSTCSPQRQRVPTTCVLEGNGSANLVAHKANAWALSICLALGTWHPNGNPVCFGYFHVNNDTWHTLERKGTSKGSTNLFFCSSLCGCVFRKWNHSWRIGLISGFIKACWLRDWKTLMDLTTECSGTSPGINKGVWHMLELIYRLFE